VTTVVIEGVAPRLLGPALMVAAAILVKGYADVGDGFSAGVVVGVAIALRYIALGRERAEHTLPVLARAPELATAGLLVALAVGFFPVALGDPPFTHFPRPGDHVVEIGTLELITAVAFDVGLFVLVTSSLVVLVHQLSHIGEASEP
jgi:multicomponent Na+:H+ antiporter subunit B